MSNSRNDIIAGLSNIGEVVIKPTVDSGSGKNVRFLKIENGVDDYSKETLEEIMAQYNNDFNIQECIKNGEVLKKLYPDSVNTFRVVTYIWNNRICHMPITLRIGQGGNKLDNAHAGGMFVAVTDEGSLYEKAFTEFKDEFIEHPDTHVLFKGYKIPEVSRILRTAELMHAKTPQLGVMSWDMTLDECDQVVLIEVNTIGQTVWFPQMASGRSAFGDNTAEILQSVRKSSMFRSILIKVLE